MTDQQDFAFDAAIDAAVSSAYRSSATEKVPAHLDRLVLAEVRRSATRKTGVLGLPAWLVPAAVAAVAALSLTLNLEFNRPDDTPAVQYQAGGENRSTPETTAGPAGNLETAAEATGRRLRALDDAVSGLAPANNSDYTGIGDTGQSVPAAADAGASDRACNSGETASAEMWWACIQALERNGQADDATAELELLQTAFPEYRLTR
jgi:hypothetical protein